MKRFIPLLVLLFVGCATTGASLDHQIYAADQAVTTIVTGTDAAYNAKLITKAQAQSVSTIAHQVNPLLDAARAALAMNDTASASKTMALVAALLAGLQAYVPAAPLPVAATAKP